MNCDCVKYSPIKLSRKSINLRIRETKEIIKALVLLIENIEQWLKLFKCPVCNQYWQTGHEWNFKDQEYIFQVPEVEIGEWLEEPYAQPAAMMMYSARMESYFEQNSFEESSKPCRTEGCEQKAIKLSAFCQPHHIEHLQKARLLPKRFSGKMFLPYS